MTSKEALERIESTFAYNKKGKKNVYSIFMGEFKVIEEYYKDYNKIKQDLERLEQLEKIFSDSHICEIKARFNEIECSSDKCDNCPLGIGDDICLKNTFEKKWELQQENQELKKPKFDLSLLDNVKKIEVDYNEELLAKIKDLEADVDGWKTVAENYEKHLKNYRKENQELKKAIEMFKRSMTY